MLIRFLSLLVVVLAVTSCVWGDESLVTATYEPLSQGYLLRFTLHNTLQQEYLTSLYVSTFYNATNLLSPPEWTSSFAYGEILWMAGPSSYLQPGQSEHRFGFTSQNSPNVVYWNVRSNAKHYNGFLTPTLVPEPSSILALAGGLASIGGIVLKRRRS